MIEVRLEIFVKNPALFSVHQLKGFIILLYLITGDVNFVHLVALVSSAFLHCQVPIIFFVVGVTGETLWDNENPIFIQTFIHWKILPATLITVV